MVEAKRRDEWDHTALICKTIADVHRGPKDSPYDLELFHPMNWKPPTPVPAREVVLHMRDAFRDLTRNGRQ